MRLDDIAAVVLDEADEMLDLGFAEDIEAILAQTPAGRQTALFSATLPPRIVAIARRHLNDPVRIEIGREPLAAGTVPKRQPVRTKHAPRTISPSCSIDQRGAPFSPASWPMLSARARRA